MITRIDADTPGNKVSGRDLRVNCVRCFPSFKRRSPIADKVARRHHLRGCFLI